MRCPNCGRGNPGGMRFCGYCSAPLEPNAAPEVRKTVTILFSDVTGSTALGETLDPETVRRVMGRYFDEMRSVLEAHGGTVEKFIGDAVMAVFGLPIVHEDDALRAVRAAQEMRERLVRLNEVLEADHGVSIAARTGVNTGEVVAGKNAQTLATGDAVNVAARLEQAAAPGEILIGLDTYRLVRDAVGADPFEPLDLKGKAQPVHAFRLASVEGAGGFGRRFDRPIVGRAAELAALGDGLRRAELDRSCVLVTVLGSAGVGKSRLVQEFLDRISGSAFVVRGRCLPYGDGITYGPVVQMLTAAAGIKEEDGPDQVRAKILGLAADTTDAELLTERLAQLLGIAGAAAAPEETHWAVRTFLEATATSASSPLVAFFDDLHWAQPSLFDLIEYVAYSSRDTPILLLGTARPELLEDRPGWGSGRLDATTLVLEPLSELESEQLVANLLDNTRLPKEAQRSITQAAEGNPLFVEQMVAMLIDDGVLGREGGRWAVKGDLASVSPPASVMLLLGARLERLTPDERGVVERASIEGEQFHAGSVRALSPEPAPVAAALMSLVRRDMIRPDRGGIAGEDAFRFPHILLRDAAYQRIPKQMRAGLHERHAAWLERSVGDRQGELDEIVGYHLEQAYRLRAELGPIDEEARGVAARAAGYLLSGGRRAADRGDAAAASNLLGRAAELLPEDHPERPKLLTELSVQLAETGDIDQARGASDAAEATAGPSPDPSVQIAIGFARLTMDAAMEPEGVTKRMKELAERAIPGLETIGDDRGLAQAWLLVGEAELFGANNARVLQACSRALDHAERAGDRAAASEAAIWCMLGISSGPTPPDEGLIAIDALLTRVPDSLGLKAWSKITQGKLLAMIGRADEGRGLVKSGWATLEELGRSLTYGGASIDVATFEDLAGDLEAAEERLRGGYEVLAPIGEKGYLSTLAGRLARYAAIRGDLEEAEELARVSEEAAATDDIYSQASWRSALGLVHAKQGQHERALVLAEEAVDLAMPSDDCHLRAETLEDLAMVHRLAGRIDETREALRRAIDIWDRKGAWFIADRMRAKRSELTSP